jgi:hypothetical protein
MFPRIDPSGMFPMKKSVDGVVGGGGGDYRSSVPTR